MKSSLHSLIHFFHFFSITFDCHIQNSIQFSTTTLSNNLLCPFITSRHKPRRTQSFSIVEVCLLIRCLAMNVLLLRTFASARMCLPSRCLEMGFYVTILKITASHKIVHSRSKTAVFRRSFNIPPFDLFHTTDSESQ
jgi:hypothetical protein